jgi:hypothetical protein
VTNSYHSYYGGEHVTQHGNGNIGMIKHGSAGPPQAALSEVIGLVHALREQVPPGARPSIDESLAVLESGTTTEPRSLRRALENVARIATAVGQIGVPVVESARRVMAAFGL